MIPGVKETTQSSLAKTMASKTSKPNPCHHLQPSSVDGESSSHSDEELSLNLAGMDNDEDLARAALDLMGSGQCLEARLGLWHEVT